MVATLTKPGQTETPSASIGANGTALTAALYLLAAALAGILFWWVADWNVYLQGSEGLFEPKFRLTGLEQLTISAIFGSLAAGMPFGYIWLARARAAGLSWLERFGPLVGIGGAILGVTLLYLSLRVGGDFWTHFHLLGLDVFSYLFLIVAVLLASQPAALAIGLYWWRSPYGKAALAVSVPCILFFAVLVLGPLVWIFWKTS